MDVARIDGSDWAISARGFNDQWANKLLVLIDGRTIYTPLVGGVSWDMQDVLLDDIDRIEVIRGPGGTVWGANAVNGVINIISKRAKDTQGGLATAGGGTEERAFGALQYGGNVGGHGHYRIYSKYFNRQPDWGQRGFGSTDEWDTVRGGFRSDWDLSARDGLTVEGDAFSGEIGRAHV